MSKQVIDAIQGLIKFTERETCRHEETERLGAIWTKCLACERYWADDEGGFKPYEDPPELTEAYKALEELQAHKDLPSNQETYKEAFADGWLNAHKCIEEFGLKRSPKNSKT